MSGMMVGAGNRKFTPLFENLHLNPSILRNICFLNKYLRIPCVVGKSMLVRKTDLETLGGLRAFQDVLAEEDLIGEKMKRRGYKVIVSNYLISNVNEYWGVSKFVNRHMRWGKMRWKVLRVKDLLRQRKNMQKPFFSLEETRRRRNSAVKNVLNLPWVEVD